MVCFFENILTFRDDHSFIVTIPLIQLDEIGNFEVQNQRRPTRNVGLLLFRWKIRNSLNYSPSQTVSSYCYTPTISSLSNDSGHIKKAESLSIPLKNCGYFLDGRILYIPVPQTAHLPFKAGLPFFIVTLSAFCISLFALHLTQKAVSATAITSFHKEKFEDRAHISLYTSKSRIFYFTLFFEKVNRKISSTKKIVNLFLRPHKSHPRSETPECCLLASWPRRVLSQDTR